MSQSVYDHYGLNNNGLDESVTYVGSLLRNPTTHGSYNISLIKFLFYTRVQADLCDVEEFLNRI